MTDIGFKFYSNLNAKYFVVVVLFLLSERYIAGKKIVMLPSTLVGKCLGGGNVFDWQGVNRDKL